MLTNKLFPVTVAYDMWCGFTCRLKSELLKNSRSCLSLIPQTDSLLYQLPCNENEKNIVSINYIIKMVSYCKE